MKKSEIQTNLIGKHARLRRDIVNPDERDLSLCTFEIVAAFLNTDREVELVVSKNNEGTVHSTFPNMIVLLPRAQQPRSAR